MVWCFGENQAWIGGCDVEPVVGMSICIVCLLIMMVEQMESWVFGLLDGVDMYILFYTLILHKCSISFMPPAHPSTCIDIWFHANERVDS